MMRANWWYLRYVLKHKWFVFWAGIALGSIPIWRLLIHDWTKFLPREWVPYRDYFYGGNKAKKFTDSAFDIAWNHHQHKNDHHWQFWILHFDDGGSLALPMSDVARREMIADWFGAGRCFAKKPDTAAWFRARAAGMFLHPNTRQWIETTLMPPWVVEEWKAGKLA